MNKILIYSQSFISKDPRVYKQVTKLAQNYEVFTLGYGNVDLKNVTSIDINYGGKIYKKDNIIDKIKTAHSENRLIFSVMFKILGIFPAWIPILNTSYKNYLILKSKNSRVVIDLLNKNNFDLIIANDFTSLPICVAASMKKDTKIIYDAHEYTPGQSTQNKKWVRKRLSYIQYALKKYLPECDRVITVCDTIAKEYEKTFCIARPDVIRNVSPYCDIAPQNRNDGKIKLVHHGVAARQRSIEDMIKVIGKLDERFELYLYLVHKDDEYYSELKKLAKNIGRVYFMQPVPLVKITSTLNMYDIGLYILPPKNFNQLNALPNKLFEFIQARLAIAIAPSPEMSKIVSSYNLGVISEDFTFDSMAKAIQNLDDNAIRKYKENSHSCARELSAEIEMEKFSKIVEEVINA